MDNKELVKALREESLYANKATLEIMDYCMSASDLITSQKAEIDRLTDENKQLKELSSLATLAYVMSTPSTQFDEHADLYKALKKQMEQHG